MIFKKVEQWHVDAWDIYTKSGTNFYTLDSGFQRSWIDFCEQFKEMILRKEFK